MVACQGRNHRPNLHGRDGVSGTELAERMEVTWVRCSATAWLTSHTNPAEAQREANRSTRDSSSLPQKTLAVAQATVSIVLLAVARLVTRSLQKMEHQDFGFQTDHRVNISVNAPFSSYSPEKLNATYHNLQDRLWGVTQTPD